MRSYTFWVLTHTPLHIFEMSASDGVIRFGLWVGIVQLICIFRVYLGFGRTEWRNQPIWKRVTSPIRSDIEFCAKYVEFFIMPQIARRSWVF